MARVTVEDCIKIVPNRFELVLGAAQRARELVSGAVKTIEAKDKKVTVVSLREIAAGNIDVPHLLEKIMSASQRLATDETEDDDQVAFDNVKVIGTDDIHFQTITQRNAEEEFGEDEEDEDDEELPAEDAADGEE